MAASLQLVQAHLDEHPYAALALQTVGALSAASFLYSFVSFFFRTFLRPGISLKKFGSRDDAWAVVTGASDGIGREFALQLAKAGFNVLIAARNPEKLAAVAREIVDKTSGNAEVKAFAIDFAHADEATWENFGKTVQGLDVGVLVNNVGKSHEMPTEFVETPADEISDILAINVNATVRVTSIVSPGMVSRRRGLIMNLGSFAGSAPSPMLATYSASKAFIATFSDALAAELGPKGVIVEHANTYFVVSAMSKIRRPSLMIPTPAAYVRSVLAKIAPGSQAPFWTHAALAYVMDVAPTGFVVSYMHALHWDIRKRALRKKERQVKRN